MLKDRAAFHSITETIKKVKMVNGRQTFWKDVGNYRCYLEFRI